MQLSSIFNDGMVLQRNQLITISGKTKPNLPVQVKFLNKTYEASADETGNFSISLDKFEPGGPYKMEIIADETKVINDILIGDVWVLGGQSNMELPLNRTLDLLAEQVAQINEPFIRQFAVPQEYDFHGPREVLTGGSWTSATHPNVMDFSAVGYFFAQKIYKKTRIPIGLIMTAVGGTPIEAWMKEETLRPFKRYDELLEKSKDDDYVQNTIKKDEENNHQWYEQLNSQDLGLQEKWYLESYQATDWTAFEVPNSWEGTELENVRGAVWFRKEIDVPASMTTEDAMLKLGTIVDADDTYINGTRVGTTGYQYPPRRYTVPKGILKPGKNTLTVRVISTHNTGKFIQDMPYKLIVNDEEINLTGTWHYKVGAVTENAPSQTFFQYFPAGVYNGMIAPLKQYQVRGVLWYQGESNAGNPKGYHVLFEKLVNDWRENWQNDELPFFFTQLTNLETNDPNHGWAVLREEQRKCLKIPNTAMAVTIDVGEYNDLHPQNKKAVGERLALPALNKVYGEDIVYSGPLYRSMERIGNSIHITFDHIGSGLTIREDDQLKSFMICGKDGKYVPATATIVDNKVIVSHENIPEPMHVRYAWHDNPEDANLYNKEGLPASPFSTETE